MDGLKTIKDESESCVFCKLKEINELKYGPLYKRDGLVAHYYCVLFSNVCQKGTDDEGILGFLVRDIKNELKRVSKVFCHYCSKPNASVSCWYRKQCNRSFHFPCGILKKSLHQYKGQFKSFCPEHRPRQKIPPEYLTEAQKNKPKCVVCYEDVDYTCETDVLWANCCLKTWYHRDCLQKFALSSGYLFKCAICNNRRQFKQWVEEYGIFVPKQDASWELEPNAFSELLVQHGKCDAVNCICPFGREFSSDRQMSEWEIILCKTCASQGIHPACYPNRINSNWECDLCKLVRCKLRYRRTRHKPTCTVRPIVDNRERTCSITMTGNEDFNNIPTSSCSSNLISLQAVASGGRIIRSRTERKRKRTEVQDDKTESKKTAFENCQNGNQGSQTSFQEGSTTGYAHSSTAVPNFHAYNADTDDEAVDIEEVERDTSDEDEEIIVDGPEAPFNGTSSNNEIEESRRRDEEILIIDLTGSGCSMEDEDEVESDRDTYRSIQLSDVRYRVKKEVYVVSDDDDDNRDHDGNEKKDDNSNDKGNVDDAKPDDSELEVILHKDNSQDSEETNISRYENDTNSSSVAGISRNSASSDVSLVVHLEDEPSDEERSQDKKLTPFDEDAGDKAEEREVEVLDVLDEATPSSEVKPKSSVETENSQGGSSSRASAPPDRKYTSDFFDKYFFIFLKEKENEKRLGRLRKNIRRVIVKHGKKYRSKYYQHKRNENEEEDSHVTVSSDSENDDDDDDDEDDDVQIISSTSD